MGYLETGCPHAMLVIIALEIVPNIAVTISPRYRAWQRAGRREQSEELMKAMLELAEVSKLNVPASSFFVSVRGRLPSPCSCGGDREGE
jgi:hypothetical protein